MQDDIIYLKIPKEYICIYHKLLVMMADLGKEILNDCTSSCKGNNKIIIDCWNMFQSALACRELGKTKQENLFIDYIKKQITSIYKGTDNEEYNGNYIFIKEGSVINKYSCNNLEKAKFETVPSTGELLVSNISNTDNINVMNNDLIVNGKNLGKVSITNEGNYIEGKEYKKLTIVNKNNTVYLSKENTSINTKLRDEKYWDKLCGNGSPYEKGDIVLDNGEVISALDYYNNELSNAIGIVVDPDNRIFLRKDMLESQIYDGSNDDNFKEIFYCFNKLQYNDYYNNGKLITDAISSYILNNERITCFPIFNSINTLRNKYSKNAYIASANEVINIFSNTNILSSLLLLSMDIPNKNISTITTIYGDTVETTKTIIIMSVKINESYKIITSPIEDTISNKYLVLDIY